MIGILFQGIGEMTYGVSELPFLGGNLPKQKIELAPILDGDDGWRMQQPLGEFGIADAALDLHPAAPQPEMVRKQRGGFARGLQGGMPVSRRAQQVTAPRGNRRVDTEAFLRLVQQCYPLVKLAHMQASRAGAEIGCQRRRLRRHRALIESDGAIKISLERQEVRHGNDRGNVIAIKLNSTLNKTLCNLVSAVRAFLDCHFKQRRR